uniref:Uncharacterized protein n=1 Tax=Aegilops tauschii subsp. strangulata TaxID=200361 RepID=A0A453SE98_AEGTS
SRRSRRPPVSAVVKMLHHSNSRQQRNRGSKIKTLLKVTLLLGVAVWLAYQVKHSYDKKNEYYNATEDQLSHDDRSMFQGRKERLGTNGDGNVEKAIETTDVIGKQEEEKSGESVFEKDNTDSHDDDSGNTERSEAEEGQASRADDNAEAHRNETSESNSSDAETKTDVHSTGDDVPHEEEAQSDGSANAGQIDASGNGSDGEQAEKKGAVESQADSESLSEDTKAGTGDEHSAETLPDETGNIPAVHNANPQGDAASSTSDAYGHSNSETVHVEIGSEHEGARTSSVTTSGDAEKGNSVETNPSDSISAEEKAGGDGEKGSETSTANEASGAKEANPEEGNAAAEVRADQAANTQTENSDGASAAAEGANGGSLEEAKAVENQIDGATKASSNGDQDDIKIETNTSTSDVHNEHQSVDASSGSIGSNDTGPEQTGKTETQ